MLEILKANRLLNLKKQQLKIREEALKSMQKGDLTAYFKKLKEADKLKVQITETALMEV